MLIVSFDETKSLDEEESITVVDSLIGQVLAHKEYKQRLKEIEKDIGKTIQGMQEEDAQMYVEDLVWGEEIQAELNNDPLTRMACEYELECFKSRIIKTYSLKYYTDPPVPCLDLLNFSADELETYLKALEQVNRCGCEITVETSSGMITERAWVRNFDGFGLCRDNSRESCQVSSLQKGCN